MRGKGSVFLIIWASLMTLIVLGLVGFEMVRMFGKSNLSAKSATSTPMMAQEGYAPVESSSATTWQSDWVRYNGEVYDYNEDITTFLIMGIDKDDEVVTSVPEGADAGQADALFLVVLDPHKNAIEVIGINRNSMTDVDIYDDYGRYQTTMISQIAVQHAFGDGMEKSCEFEVKAVSNMFYQLPIHGYAAINMSAIPTINDKVGGVDVTVLEDLTKFDKTLKKGTKVHLEGEHAFHYVKSRDISIYASNDSRLERQKQYLNGFISALREKSSEDPGFAVDMFKSISDMMVTNISVDEISYLAPYITSYSFDPSDLRTIDGKTQKTGKYEEFIIDEDSLYQTIIDVFYEKVDYEG